MAEDGGPVTITVTSTEAAPAGGLTANLRVSGTATRGSGGDYTLTFGTTPITPANNGDFTRPLAAGQSSLSFQVAIRDDGEDEAEETVRFEVRMGTGYVRGSPSSAELRITDNDEPTVSFALDGDNNRAADANEGATLMLTANISPAPRAALTVDVMTATGTTAQNADYSLGTLRFNANAATATLRVDVTDDGEHEAAETLVLELRDGTDYAVAGTAAERRYTVTIPANDLPVLSFAASSATAAEADGNVAVIVNASPAPRAGVTLSVPITTSGTATEGAAGDYVLSGLSAGATGNLSIMPGSSTATFMVALEDDDDVEVQETVVLSLGAMTGYTLGTPRQYTLTVSSEDMLPRELSIAASAASVEEGEGPVTITVTSSRAVAAGDTLTANLRVSSAAAQRGGANSDYTLTFGTTPITPDNNGDFTRTIAASQDSLSFQVTISDDNVNEADETLRFEVRSSTAYSLGATSSVDVRITDDDTPTVSFALDDDGNDRMANANEGATLTLTATIAPAPANDLTVGVGTVTGTTTAVPADYSLGTLRFAATETSTTLIVQVTNDAEHEAAETLVLELQGGTGYAVTGTAAASRYTVTIPANDLPVLDFAVGAASAAEADGDVAVIVDVSPVPRTGVTLSVPITTSGTATEGAAGDYTLSGLSSGNLSIAPGSSTATFTVALRNDIEVENPETIVLSLGAGTRTDYMLGTTRQYTLTVSSEDRLPILSFDVGSRTVAENGRTSTVTVRANPAPQSNVTFTLRVSGTATRGATGDYTLPAGITPAANGDFTRTITTGAGSLTFDVGLVDDSVDETNPTVIFTLRPDTAMPPTYQVGSRNAQFTLTITDDDDPLPQIQFSGTAAATVSEGAASTNIGIESTANAGRRLSVNYQVCSAATTPRCSSDSTASSGDYSGLPASIAIARGQASGNMIVTLVDDILDENNEILVLRLMSGTGYTLGTRLIYTLTITDNDIPLVAFADSASTVAEDAGSATVTAVAVILNPDYDADAADDGAPFSGNDDQYVYISPVGNIVVPVRVSGAAARPADYTLSGLGGSAPNYTLTIPSTSTPEADITVTVVNDSADESNETVVFTLSNPSGEPRLRAGGGTHTLTILDDDMPLPTVTFEASKSVGEGARTATVQLMLSVPSPGLTLSYQVDNTSTATAGADYTALAGSVTVPANDAGTPAVDESRQAAISVSITDDTADESDETIVLVLRASTGNYLLGNPSRHTLTITDNDVPMVSFATPSNEVAENAAGAARNVSVTVNVSPAPARDLSVALTFAGAATLTGAGADYSLSGVTGTTAVRQLAVRSGRTAASFTVGVTDDSVFEGNEDVAVSFAAPATNAGYAVAGSGLTYTLTITENDPMPTTPMVRFSMAASSASEPASGTATANVQVRLHPTTMTAPVGGLPVRYQLQTSTAVEGAANDYTIGGFDRTASTGTVTIPQGSNAINIPIAIRADTVAEADETINLRLIGPASGAADYTVIAANRDHALTIGANGLVASFAQASSEVAEGDAATPAAVTVSLAGGNAPAGGLAVNYRVLASSTATVTSDYTIAGLSGAAGSVTIPAGMASATIPITVQPDSVAESAETIVLQLVAPTGVAGYRVGTESEHTLTVPANDTAPGVPTLGFSEAGPVDARESGAAAIVSAAMSPAPASQLVVTATLNAGTVPASDYAINPAGRSLTFTNAAPAATLTITANEDTDMDNERITLGLPAGASYSLREGRSSIEVVLRDNDNTAPAANFIGAATGSYRERDRRKGGSDVQRGPYRLRIGLPSAAPTGGMAVSMRARPSSTVTYGTGADYTLGGGARGISSEQGANRDTTFTVRIAANAMEASFTVIVPDDYQWELDETLAFTVLDDPDTTMDGAYSVGAMSRHVLTLQDGNGPVVLGRVENSGSRGSDVVTYDYFGQSHSHVLTHQLSGGSPAATERDDDDLHLWRVNEGAGSLTVAVHSSAAMLRDAQVHVNFYRTVSHIYGPTARSASNGEDYMPPAQTLNFPAGQTSLSFNVQIVDDLLLEGPEVIHMQITTPGLHDISGVLGIYGNTEGDDGCTEPTSGDRDRRVLTRAGPCELNDLLAAKAQQGTYAITIADDDLPRPGFAQASGPDVAELAIAGGATVTRNVDIDLEGVPQDTGLISSLALKLRFMATTGDVAVAASGMAEVLAAVQAEFANQDDPADDHTLMRDSESGLDWTLTVPAGATETGITLTFNDDTVTEGREVLEVRLLSDPLSPRTYLQGATTAHAIAIVDDDLPTVGFARNTVTVTEATAPGATAAATISFSSDIASAAATTVRYAVNGASGEPASTAQSGADYQALAMPMQVVIPANQTTATLTVTVLGDAAPEGDEQLALRLPSGNDAYDVDPMRDTFTLIIDDQDAPSQHRVQFSMAESSIDENDRSVNLAVEVDRPARTALTIPVTVNTGSGNAEPADYGLPSPSNVVIAQGTRTTDLTVTITNDALLEGSETLVLEIGNLAGVPGDVIRGDPTTHTLTILDNESAEIGFATTSARVDEDVGTQNVMLTVSQAPSETLTISTYSAAGTATAGNDYTLPASITVSAGATAAVLPIRIVDDSDIEGAETIELSLTDGPPGSSYTAGSANMHTLTINASDLPQLGFRVASGDAQKGRGNTRADTSAGLHIVRMVFSRYPAAGATVPVRIRVAGTATMGNNMDYVLTGATLVSGDIYTVDFQRNMGLQFGIDLRRGATNGDTVQITLLEDTAVPAGYQPTAGMTVYTATVRDPANPTPTVSFNTVQSLVTEGSSESVAIAIDTTRIAGTLTYRVVTAESTAESADYSLSPSGTIRFGFQGTPSRPSISLTAPQETGAAVADTDHEVVVLELTAGSGYVLGDTTKHYVYITDDDATPPTAAVANLLATASSVREYDRRPSNLDRASYRLRVSLSSAAPEGGVAVSMRARPSSTVTYGTGADYTLGGGAGGISSEQGANRDTTFTVTIAEDNTEASFTVVVSDDYQWEHDETLTFTLLDDPDTAMAGAYAVGRASTFVLTLRDGLQPIVLGIVEGINDVVRYDYFGQSHSHVLTHRLSGGTPAATEQTGDDEVHRWRVNEGAGRLTVTVSQEVATTPVQVMAPDPDDPTGPLVTTTTFVTNELLQDVQVHVNFYPRVSHLYPEADASYTPPRPTSLGDDYLPPARIINFPAGQTEVSFQLDIVDDMQVEGFEAIHMQITTPGLPGALSGVLGIYGNNPGDDCPEVKQDSLSACELSALLSAKAQEGLYAIVIVDDDLPRAGFAQASGTDVLESTVAAGTTVTRDVDIELGGVSEELGLPSSVDLKLRFMATTGDVTVAASGMAEVLAAVQAEFANQDDPADDHTLMRDSESGLDWTLTVPAGATETGIVLTFGDDTAPEMREVLEVRLLPDPSSPGTYLRGATTTYAIAIVDND
ncbi:MAG: hypothetical protein OXU61_10775 [Gammaproteobacteria bacterium]|nr:hypothetical protein [Gammaproteobacteria bacterium]